VRSLPDGLSQVLEDYLRQRTDRLNELKNHPAPEHSAGENGNGAAHHVDLKPTASPTPAQPLLKIGDLCPECGQAAVVNEEGCRKCYACGYSEC
jgi:ribonucleoside-diphosphate reductase alpha chain